jgi:periplasmic mercuric ion binding protein
MKKIFLTTIIAAGASLVSNSQPVKAQLTAKIKTPTVGCEECKKRIETYLLRYDGVMTINVNWRAKITTIKYLTDRTNIEELKTAIANIGYDADDIPANEEYYKMLPKTCKKPEDGGPAKAPNIHKAPPPQPTPQQQ